MPAVRISWPSACHRCRTGRYHPPAGADPAAASRVGRPRATDRGRRVNGASCPTYRLFSAQGEVMHTFLQDVRYAVRTLRRSAGLTAVIVTSLAIGIGANTAVFSVVNALLLEPLPYPDPDRLVVLWLRSPGINIPQDWPSPGQYVDLQTENQSFEEMSISQGRTGTLIGLERPERVQALRTSSSLFHLLGAKPLHGRLLLPDEDQPGKPPVVILSHGFWTRMFNADPAIVGRSITLNGVAPGSGENKNLF